MKNVLRLSIALSSALYSYTVTNITGDLTQRIEIKQSGSITANRVDDKINAFFVIGGNLTTKSDETNKLIFDYENAGIDNKDYLILVSGGNFTDTGSIFKSQGYSVFSNNIQAIKIEKNGVVTLNNSSVFAGNADHSTFQNSPAILVDYGTLNLNNSLVEGGNQRGNSYQAINAIGFGTDKVSVNISGSIIKAGKTELGEYDKSSQSINGGATSIITIDDTKNTQGSKFIGRINTLGDFTLKGIYKNQATFNAKDITQNLKVENTIFDTTIDSSAKTLLEKNANIDKAYIGGGLDLNQSSNSNAIFSITNSYIAGDIINGASGSNSTSITNLDNVFLEGELTSYAGDIVSSNSMFSKKVSNAKGTLNDTNSIFKTGFSVNSAVLNGSILEGIKLPAISGAIYQANNFTLTNTKVGKDLDNTKGYLELMGGAF